MKQLNWLSFNSLLITKQNDLIKNNKNTHQVPTNNGH